MPGSLCLGPEWKSHFTSVTESAKRHCCVLVSPRQRAECWTSRGHEDNTTSWVVIQSLLAWKLRAFLVAQMVKNLPAMQETQVWSLGGEDPLKREWQPIPVFLLGESHGQRSLAGLQSTGSPRVGHDWMTDTFTSLFYWTCTHSRLWESWGACHLLATSLLGSSQGGFNSILGCICQMSSFDIMVAWIKASVNGGVQAAQKNLVSQAGEWSPGIPKVSRRNLTLFRTNMIAGGDRVSHITVIKLFGLGNMAYLCIHCKLNCFFKKQTSFAQLKKGEQFYLIILVITWSVWITSRSKSLNEFVMDCCSAETNVCDIIFPTWMMQRR